MLKRTPPKEVIINIPFGTVLKLKTKVIHVVLLYFSSHRAYLYVTLFVSLAIVFFKYSNISSCFSFFPLKWLMDFCASLYLFCVIRNMGVSYLMNINIPAINMRHNIIGNPMKKRHELVY